MIVSSRNGATMRGSGRSMSRPVHGSGRATGAGLRGVIDRDAVEQLRVISSVPSMTAESAAANQMGQAADDPAGALMQVRAKPGQRAGRWRCSRNAASSVASRLDDSAWHGNGRC